MKSKRRTGFSYGDSAIRAANFIWKSLSHGQEVEGVMIVNPFR